MGRVGKGTLEPDGAQGTVESRPLKVCMVGSLPPPIGGVATMCYNLGAQLHRLGVEISFLDTNRGADKKIPPEIHDYEMIKPTSAWRITAGILRSLSTTASPGFLARLSGECFRYRKNLRVSGIMSVSMVAVSLFNKLSKNRVNLIHTHHAYPRSLAALIVGKALDIPVVVNLIASEFTSGMLRDLRPVAVHISNEADALTAISEHTANAARKNGVKGDIEVIYLGVDTDVFRSDLDVGDLRKRFNINGDRVILYTGWLIERKGPQLLLEAVTGLNEGKTQVFLIGPDHGLKHRLESQAQQLSSDNMRIHVLGPVDDRTLRSFYVLADVLVSPTITDDDGFGLVPVEAQASGTPVIGARIGATPEVVRDNETGLLFNPGDSKDLGRKIRMLLHDDKLLSRMKARTREHVQANFTWEVTGRKTARLYRETVRRYNAERKGDS